MSLRGKEDLRVTKNLRDAGKLEHPDSFVRQDGHLCFEGPDKSAIRAKVFKRYKNRCCICNALLDPAAIGRDPKHGDWHHVENCDCVDCSELRCSPETGRACHAHRTIGFERKAQAIADFDKVNPPKER